MILELRTKKQERARAGEKNNRENDSTGSIAGRRRASDNAIYTVLASASSYDRFMKIIQRLPPAITSATTLANVDIIVARYLLKRSLLPPPFLHSWDFRPVCEQESVLSFHPRLDPNLAGLVISANVIVL